MTIELEKASKVIGWWTVIITAAVTVWLTISAYFATRLMLEQKDLRRIDEDITHNEVVRDHYQSIIDMGKRELEPEEMRRHRVSIGALDRLYREKEIAEDTIREMEQ